MSEQPTTPAPDPTEAALEHRNAVEKEYGEFVAVQQIFAGNALAYNVGDPVPKSNVEAHGYLDAKLVARRNTQAGRAALDGQPTV